MRFEVVSPSGCSLVGLSLKQSFREHRYRLGDSESCMMSYQTTVSSSTAIACISSSTQQNRKAGTVLSVSCGMASHDHVLPPAGGGLQCSSLAVHSSRLLCFRHKPSLTSGLFHLIDAGATEQIEINIPVTLFSRLVSQKLDFWCNLKETLTRIPSVLLLCSSMTT